MTDRLWSIIWEEHALTQPQLQFEADIQQTLSPASASASASRFSFSSLARSLPTLPSLSFSVPVPSWYSSTLAPDINPLTEDDARARQRTAEMQVESTQSESVAASVEATTTANGTGAKRKQMVRGVASGRISDVWKGGAASIF
jgi:hypothetical protein